ncbi:MAG TPA: glutamate racemase [Thermodesulfovibrionales bacterium]|nr:glutamate racemase [Thermodesulfovibrionales bacterium]
MEEKPIGVFDSGIGGLTVLKEIFRELSGESTVYLGDTARVPYGIRSDETVARYSFENTGFLVARKIKLLVVACNTVSAVSLDAIKEKVSIPVIGVIEPGSKAAVKATRNGRVGVIGTEATIHSGAYARIIKSIDNAIEVLSLPCPLFVPLAEEGLTDDEIAVMVAEKYLKDLREREIDTLVLGCTHYPLLKGVISKVMGEGIALIDSAVETVREIKRTLRAYGIEGRPAVGDAVTAPGLLRMFYVTDSAERFIRVGERFLGQKIEHIEKINLGGY